MGQCKKSKRGVVIWDNKERYVSAYNSPPKFFICDKICIKNCNEKAVHAEQRAILLAFNNRMKLSECDMMHVKTINNKLVISGGPSCIHCSKMIVENKIKNMWLYEVTGWEKYSAINFHKITMKNIGI